MLCVLDDADAEVEEDDDAAEADDESEAAEDIVLCAALLALCDASFCESMLCCRVCANNGWALAASTGALVDELPDEPSRELINESGDMADPVCPVNPLDVRMVRMGLPKRIIKRAIKRVKSSG